MKTDKSCNSALKTIFNSFVAAFGMLSFDMNKKFHRKKGGVLQHVEF